MRLRSERWPAALCLATLNLGVACSTPVPPQNPAGQADIVLPMHWLRGAAVGATKTFRLPFAAPAGSALWIDGAWWRVDLTLDGVALPAVFPGYAPVEVPLSSPPSPGGQVALPPLAAGEHTLTVLISLPTTELPVLSLANKHDHPFGGAVELRMRAASHVNRMAVPLVDGALVPTIDVVDAPEGSTVELVVSRDGAVEAAWESVAVGQALPKRTWRGGRWDIGAADLHVATAVLRSAAGVVLDVRSERVGFRDSRLDGGSLLLNGRLSPLLALRADPSADPSAVVANIADVGANALEIHGDVTSSAWFTKMDEWGLPVVNMPRCDGNLWHSADAARNLDASVTAAMKEQESRLLAVSTRRPSVLAWVCEGAETQREQTCGGLHQDALARPVLGLDVPAAPTSGRDANVGRTPLWIVELGQGPEGYPSPSRAANGFVQAVGPKGPGGVFLTPPDQDRTEWKQAWTGAAKRLGVRPWTPTLRRAPSVLVVRGLASGDIVTADAPWMATRGAVADSGGEAQMEFWYEGPATLHVGERNIPVVLRADHWQGTKRIGNAVVVDVTGA